MDIEIKRLLALGREQLQAHLLSLPREERVQLMCQTANAFREYAATQPDAVLNVLESRLSTHQPSRQIADELIARLSSSQPRH